MPAKRYRVRLTAEERKELDGQVNTGTGSARRLRRARILLMADEARGRGLVRRRDCQGIRSACAQVERVRERCVTVGIGLLDGPKLAVSV